MKLNNIYIVQRGNEYQLCLPTQVCVGYLAFPPDQQHLYDWRTLEPITKALAMRWQVYDKGKKQDS